MGLWYFIILDATLYKEDIYISSQLPFSLANLIFWRFRANAAGAIGNLVRNGDKLAAGIAAENVPLKLLQMIYTDSDISAQVLSNHVHSMTDYDRVLSELPFSTICDKVINTLLIVQSTILLWF